MISLMGGFNCLNSQRGFSSLINEGFLVVNNNNFSHYQYIYKPINLKIIGSKTNDYK